MGDELNFQLVPGHSVLAHGERRCNTQLTADGFDIRTRARYVYVGLLFQLRHRGLVRPQTARQVLLGQELATVAE